MDTVKLLIYISLKYNWSQTYQVSEKYLGQGLFIYHVLKIFRKTNISYLLILRHTFEYQGLRQISFSENFLYVLNGWYHKKCCMIPLSRKGPNKIMLCVNTNDSVDLNFNEVFESIMELKNGILFRLLAACILSICPAN